MTAAYQRDLVSASFIIGDAAYISAALSVVAQAQGIAELAEKAGLAVDKLARELSEGDPRLSTVLCVLRALDLRLEARSVGPEDLEVTAC